MLVVCMPPSMPNSLGIQIASLSKGLSHVRESCIINKDTRDGVAR